MGETGLMRRGVKLPIRLPAVALQHARDSRAPITCGRLREAASRLDRVDGRLRRDKRPEPLQVGVDAPAGFIGGDDRTAAHRRTQRVIRRLRLARRAMDRVHQPAARDAQPEAVAQQRGDLAVGQPEAFIEEHGEGDGLRPQLHGGGAERVGGLQRMATLDAPPALRAPTDRDVKRADDRALHRQLFLILRRDAHAAHRAVHSADTAPAAARRRSRRCASAAGDARARPYAAPALRPGRFGAATRVPRENGAAWR